MKSSVRAILLGSAAVLSWSTVATAFKVALSLMTVFQMLFVACATALIIFAIWMTVTKSWHELRCLSVRMWMQFAGLGLLAPVSYYLMLFTAYDNLPAQIAQPINYIWPILLALMIAVIERKPIPPVKYLGMGVSLAGVVFISVGGSAIMGSVSFFGILMAVASAFLWGVYWMINDSLKEKISEISALFLTFLFGMAYLALGTILFPLPEFSVEALLSGAYIGAFEMGIPYICFGLAIRTTDNPALINQMCYLAPFLSLMFISVILEEPIVATTYIGLALIIGGIVYNQYFAGRTIRLRRNA